MATTIIMPQMGYDMREGTVVRWRKREGDTVSRGDVIAEIETDKATVEMESFSTGVLGRIVVDEGRTVPVGELIALIIQPGEVVPPIEEIVGSKAPSAPPSTSPPPVAAGEGRVGAPAGAQAAPTGEVRASPIARRLATEKGIDLALVSGTGPGGRITEADVLGYEERGAAAPPAGKIELTRMRRAIARVTSQSKREAPHFYVTSEIDMDAAMAFRRQLNDALPDDTRVSVNDLVVKAAAKALERFPKFNGSFQEDHLQLNADLNIGIAVALEEGLIVPAIGGCQQKSLVEIAKASTDLIQRAQSGTLTAGEYTGSSFSVSNLGMFEVDNFAAIILPPNAAVLAVGAVKEQAVVRDGQVAIAQIMKATLSVDHRVADGAESAEFLMEVKRHLEHPMTMLI